MSKEIVDEVEVRSYELNKSSWFILPLLELNINKNPNFINSYILIKNKHYNVDTIFVELYSEDNKLENSKLFINKYQTNNGVMYAFEVPSYYKEEYSLFLKGKYSKYSDKAKLIICKNAAGKQPVTSTAVYGILYKTDERKKYIEELIGEKLDKDAELCSIPNLEKEIYEW